MKKSCEWANHGQAVIHTAQKPEYAVRRHPFTTPYLLNSKPFFLTKKQAHEASQGEKGRKKGGNRRLLVAKNVILRRNKPKFETIDNEPYYLLKIGNLPFLW